MMPRQCGLHVAVGTLTVAILVSGCAAPHLGNTTSARAGHVYCLRGLLDVFSLGLNNLASRLRNNGIAASAVSGPSWRNLGREIRRARQQGDLRNPLVLIGHSYGADNALRLARDLQRWGIDVELLVLLDATNPPKIPVNVARCVHIYRPSVFGNLFPSLFAGNPVEAECGNRRTQIVNMVVSEAVFGRAAAYIDHFNIDAKTEVHDLVLREVLSTRLKRGAWDRKKATASQNSAVYGSRLEP